jgi:hypothetical protein
MKEKRLVIPEKLKIDLEEMKKIMGGRGFDDNSTKNIHSVCGGVCRHTCAWYCRPECEGWCGTYVNKLSP